MLEASFVIRDGVRCMIGCGPCVDEPECAWHQICIRAKPAEQRPTVDEVRAYIAAREPK